MTTSGLFGGARSPSCSKTLSKVRSKSNVVQSAVEINRWVACTPSVAEVRPRHCPACDAASQPVGAPTVLWGHGLRTRQIRGPLAADGAPVQVVVEARRYQCQACHAVITVLPLGVARRRLYSRLAIALALFLWSTAGFSSTAVRGRCSPLRHVGPSAAEGWIQLRRWAHRCEELFPAVRGNPDGASLTVATVIDAVAALAPPGLRLAVPAAQVFAGAARAGR